MKTAELLIQLRELDVRLRLEGDRLCYSAPNGAFTAILRDMVNEHKSEIMMLLRNTQENTQTISLPARPRTDHIPLSFTQQQLWLFDQLEPGNTAYNMVELVRFVGYLQIDPLRQSLQELVRRHEVLRTNFMIIQEQPVQIINKYASINLPILDLSGLSPEEATNSLQSLASLALKQPFQLAKGDLLRMMLVQFAREEHILFLSIHHIIYDDWSTGVLLRELAALYTAFSQDKPSPLPALPLQYADFAFWQCQRLQGEVLAKNMDYWKHQFAGAPLLLDMPTDHPRLAIQSYRGNTHAFGLPLLLTEQLRALSRQEGITLFMILLAAFQVLLMRYSGQEDIVVGSPIAGRTHMETENLIGCFVNTLVLRTNLTGNPTFRQVLARVQKVCLEAYAHEDFPFEKLVEVLQPERSLSYSPLFQVLFTLQTVPVPTLELSELRLEPLQIPVTTSKFDLTFFLNDTPEGLVGTVEYASDLFNTSTITRLAQYFQTVLESVVADPDQQVTSIPLVSSAERQQVVQTWNATQMPIEPQCIHQLFEAQVRKTPDRTAIILSRAENEEYAEQHISYQELETRSNQLAHYLQMLGIGPEIYVGIYLDRSIEMIIGLLGILKAGGAYVPLDPTYPLERLAFMVQDSRTSIILSKARFEQSLTNSRVSMICLDKEWEHIAQYPSDPCQSKVTAENTAYVIYTSGSTGIPKGVLGRHLGMVNRCEWMWSSYPFAVHEIACQKTSLSFLDSFWEIFGPILQGIRSVIIPHEVVLDPYQLVQVLAEEQISRIVLVPSLLLSVLEKFPHLSQTLPRLNKVFTSGEELPAELSQHFKAVMPERTLINLYGSSEVSADVTYHVVSPEEQKTQRTPIGRPIANTQIYILDPSMHPVPIGIAGDLYVGGAGIAHGYLYQPGLTAERFVPDPFSQIPGARLFKTGDLGRYRADGMIEFLGRRDHQVKLRGFRIELGEIESVLRRHPHVREAIVVVAPEDQRLVAYIVSKDVSLESNTLRTWLQRRLPEYMVPAFFLVLEQLPLTESGKIDRLALPVPTGQLVERGNVVKPRTPTEEVLVGIWVNLLHVNRASVTTSFFELGGHSLLATRVLARVREIFQVEIPLRRLFETPTIRSLAGLIDKTRATTSEHKLNALVPQVRSEVIPLSFAQQRLWFLQQWAPESPFYHIPIALQLRGPLNLVALLTTLRILFDRHEGLRTTFHLVDNTPVQNIALESSVDLPLIDLQELNSDEQTITLERLQYQEARSPFDLTQGPLLRTRLLRLAHQDYVLLVTMHHIIADGWSSSIFFRELSTIYTALVQDKPISLPPLPVQYADYALWQRAWLQNALLDELLAYWQTQLADLAVLQLPTDHPRPAVQSYQGATQFIALSSEMTIQLQALSRQEGATLFMTLLAAFNLLLSCYSGQEDIAIGTPIAGRTHLEMEGLIGLFVNTLVLRTRLEDHLDFCTLLQRVRVICLQAYIHQALPFEKLVEILQPERNSTHSPLFQVSFQLQNAPEVEAQLAGLEVVWLATETESAKFDLSMHIIENEDHLDCWLQYASDLYETHTIAHMMAHWQHLLEEIVRFPHLPIHRLSLITEEETAQVLHTWNATQETYPSEACLHTLIAAQIARTPDAIALVAGTHQLSYRHLDQAANHLAHYLCSLGILPDTCIGLFLERSVDLVIAILAVLKADGAYLLLDPAYPAERLALMIDDTRIPIVLTRQSLHKLLPTMNIQVVCLDTQAHQWSQFPSTPPDSFVTPEHLAYVIYTSGSTGRPKGVLNTHRGICNRLLWSQHTFPLQTNDRLLHEASFNFDAAVWELFWPLLAGATIVLTEAGKQAHTAYLAHQLSEHQITIAHFLPSLLNLVLDQPEIAICYALRQIYCGGEVLSVELLTRCTLLLPGVTLYNQYGPTECAANSTCWICDPTLPLERLPIGRPIANVQMYICNAILQPVPIGIIGELFIGGLGVGRGYTNDSAITAERFVPDPFSQSPGARLFKTGDLGRYRADGMIEFLGRRDHQVKLRGFRIELGEIESVLRRHPHVREAVVVVWTLAPEDQRLVAYILSEDTPIQIEELRIWAQRTLPEYMIPAIFLELEQLPLTSTGKVNRRALPAPNTLSIELNNTTLIPPRSTLEIQLKLLFEETLGLNTVGMVDNFFKLGGHSLLAVRLLMRIRERFGLDIPLTAFFQEPTIEHIASILQSREISSLRSPLVALQPKGSGQPLFFIHPGGGEVICYLSLAEHIGLDHPLYALKSLGLYGEQQPLTHIEEMATVYLDAIRAIQPQGPYYLGGWSFGGIVAFEMAQQMVQQNQEIASLVILDAYLLDVPQKNYVTDYDEARLVYEMLQSLVDDREQLAMDFLSEEALRKMAYNELYNYQLTIMKAVHLIPPDADLQMVQHHLQVFKNNVLAHWTYKPQSYSGKITLVEASQNYNSDRNHIIPWESVTSLPLEIYTVPCTHMELLKEPYTQFSADIIKNRLNTPG